MKFNIVKLFISIILLFSITVKSFAQFPEGYPKCWEDSKNPIIIDFEDPNQFCPLNSKLGHKFFLVDFTSPLKQAQVDWIQGRIFGDVLIKNTPPYHKISYMKIDDTPPQSQIINYEQRTNKQNSRQSVSTNRK